MNPGPAPRPPTDRPRLNLMPSTAGVPGNMSQMSLSSSDVRSKSAYDSTPTLSRSTTLTNNEYAGTGGVAILKEGSAKCKEGLIWKQRWLVLRAFQLDFQKSQDGKVNNSIALKDVTGVARSENTKLSFEITRLLPMLAQMSRESLLPQVDDLPQKTTRSVS